MTWAGSETKKVLFDSAAQPELKTFDWCVKKHAVATPSTALNHTNEKLALRVLLRAFIWEELKSSDSLLKICCHVVMPSVNDLKIPS